MSLTRASVMASIALCFGVALGVTGHRHADDHTMYAGTRTTPALVAQIGNDVLENQRYAEWCGGVVRISGTDVSVQGCDK